MRQSKLFEVMDLSKDDSEEDTIVVRHTTTAAGLKRQRDSDVSTSNSRPRKAPRVTSATQKKADRLTSSRSHDSSTIRVAPTGPRSSPRASRVGLFSPVTETRFALSEVSTAQFQNRMQGPIAWYNPPPHKPDFLSQFSTVVSTPQASNRFFSSEVETSSSGRSRRAAATKAIASITSSPNESEDELASDLVLPTGKKRATPTKAASSKTRAKPKRKQDSDDSDFAAESVPSDEESDGDIPMDDSSSVHASESNDDDDVVITKKASKPRAKVAAKAKTTTTGKASTAAKPRATAKNMVNLIKAKGKGRARGLDQSLPPVFSIKEIFEDLTANASSHGFDTAVEHLQNSRPLRVATMCSGTESPLLALEMIKTALGPQSFEIDHLFSAELVPFKQAYIERNFNPPLIFRDITELINAFENEEQPMATTAYGAKVPVPTDIDLLIAGTSCVDYSGMNSRKKGINDGGESGDTWRAVMDFCIVARPAIVLLENVKNAPWDTQLKEYQDIDYETVGALVNTKDYYLPQIRQRGYMACFDKQKLKPGSSKAAASKWASLMDAFKRPASSPVSSFLLPTDKIARQHIRTDEPTREVDWSTCEIRQMQYRQELRLGNARPITNWSASGSMLVPDNGHLQWYQRQVERVLDTIDVGNLRKALPQFGMYDNRYKTRVVDLSQNVDRDKDHRPFGVVGCITPSGMFFVSDAGRPLTAEETLQLQGLPLDRISFTTESPSDVQDLAGNAMSTTVIGSSILSALIAGYEMIPQASANDGDPDSTPGVAHHPEPPLMASNDMSITELNSGSEVMSTADLLHKAARSLRKCYCEGPRGMTSKAMQECLDCGHTTCVACGGNPPHNYRNVSSHVSNARLAPGQFERELREMLPLRLTLGNNIGSLNTVLGGASPEYCEEVTAALKATFSFHDVRRTHCWSVLYRSDSATLELTIEDEANAEWRLFAHAPKHLPGNDRLRDLLQQPVARSQLRSQNDLLASTWQIRSPTPEQIPILVKASGSKHASRWARNGMPDFLNHFVWETLTIKAQNANNAVANMLCGEYHHLADCGTANDGLYKKADQADRPIYLFLDPTRTGPEEEDCFVFSHNKAILEYDEVRSVIARIDASWQPWSREEDGIPTTTQASLVVDSIWLPSDFKLSSTHAGLEMCVPGNFANLGEALDCAATPMLISGRLPAGLADVDTRPDDPAFFQKYGWIFEAFRRHLPPEEWLPLQNEHVNCHCEKCAPVRPELRWALSDNHNIVAQEDPATAATYERAIKARPNPLVIAVGDDRDEIQVGINITSLGHRAGARLRQYTSSEATISYTWRFTTGAKQAASFTFKPFTLLPTIGVEPFNDECGLTVTLFPKQSLALAWMREQEKGVKFLLEEIEESCLAALGWQAEVKAQTMASIKGGICADHPGFGKTILSMALIESEWIDRGKAGILSTMQDCPPVLAGLIPTAATLIICPAALLKQWQSEIVEKVKANRKVVTINSMKDFESHSISDFENATVVIVNRNVFGADTYAERLATFAGVPGPATKSGRAFTHWLKSIAQDVPAHVQILDHGFGLQKLRNHLKVVYDEKLGDKHFEMSVPSRRLRGRNYVEGKAKKKTTSAAETKAATPNIDVTQVGKPLLEIFYFNRIMVDEFHQYDPKERAAIAALKADKRWGLSATPAMDDFYDIAQTADLLGVTLRTSSGAKGVLKTKNARDMKKEMTSFEQFDLMRDVPSDSLHAHIHAADQRFLDAFVRRNIMDFNDQLVCFEHLLPVRLDVSHMALYAEISEHLNSLDMRIKKSTKAKATDRQERFHSVTNDCLTAEEALSKAAAFLDGDERNVDEIIRVRHKQVEKVLAELPDAMHSASSEEPIAFGHWKESRLGSGLLGDRDTIEEVSKIAQRFSTGSKAKKAKATQEKDSDADSADAADTKVSLAGNKEKTAKLNAMCNRLLKAKRSARYLQNVKQIYGAAKKGGSGLCHNGECQNANIHPEEAGVSVLCGHLVCRECYTGMRQQGVITCHADGCSESMQDIHLVWSQKMGDMSKMRTTHGTKAEAATNLLHKIAKKGDQAILFVQFEKQLEQIQKALKDERISATVVKNGLSAGRQVEEFVKSAKKKDQITVMVLNASDETAAGLNLQNANHVIFLSPLLRDSQYGYDSTMAQAIGRVRRYGQEKEIHVHRIFALDTIDVDILEHRERRNTVLTEQKGPSIEPPEVAKELDVHGLEKKEKTQLVCEDGHFSLRPQSWLVRCGADEDAEEVNKVKGKNRVLGWEDFSSLVKFSKTFTEDDDW